MRFQSRILVVASSVALVAAAACTSADSNTQVARSSDGDVALAPASNVAPAFTLVVEPAGTEVRYRVRERLVGKELDNDAVGVTPAVSGQIAFAADGSVIAEGSKLTIDVTGLKSDQERRDRYVQGRLLETARFPTVTFEPTSVRGGPKTLPASGSTAFSLIGNLTVHGVTKPSTWLISAKFSPSAVTGTASTGFTFAEFAIAQPRVPILLSVSDTIRLEYDFNFTVRK